jgi:uncharacterized protein (TIGR03437 family)
MGDTIPLRSFPWHLSACLLVALTAYPQIRLERVATTIRNCTDIQNAGDGSGRLFLVRQEGTIAVLRNGQLAERPFLDIRSKVSTGGERGLLGLAFPPNYREKRWFYVNYTDRSGISIIARYQLLGSDPDVVDVASERIVLSIPQPFSNHNGGQLQFGPDGMLYIGMGDGGSANDPENHGQNRRSLLGKMLRIDTESNLSRYEIPPDNPFLNDPSTRPEIWALGLRNPWRFSFDRSTGDLYISDVGQNRLEEINFQPRSSRGGENYGWVTMEGNVCVRAGCNTQGLTLPIWTYPRSEGVSVTGGYVYRGDYYFGDFGTGKIWTLRKQGETWIHNLVFDGGNSFGVSTFGLDEAGEQYVANFRSGEVFRMVLIDKPILTSSSIVNASSFSSGLAPGALMTAFTKNVLSQNATLISNTIPLPRSLQGVELRINGNTVPLLAVVRNGDNEQINFQVPWDLQPGTRAQIQVRVGLAASEVAELTVQPISPGIFGINATDALLIRASDFSLVSGAIRRGETHVLYASGLGLMDQTVATGDALRIASRLRRSASLTIGGVAADLEYAGNAPGFVGVYQVNFKPAAATPAGPQNLVLTIDSIDSAPRSVTIAN